MRRADEHTEADNVIARDQTKDQKKKKSGECDARVDISTIFFSSFASGLAARRSLLSPLDPARSGITSVVPGFGL